MESALEKRKKLIEEYNILSHQELQMEEDVLLGKRTDDISLEVDNARILYDMDRIRFELFENLKPFFKEIYRLSEEIVDVMEKTSVSQEDYEAALTRREEFSKLLDKVDKMIFYDSEDIYSMSLMIKEIDRAERENNQDLMRESIINIRILRGLSKLCEFEQEQGLFDELQAVISNLNDKLESLKGKEPSDE